MEDKEYYCIVSWELLQNELAFLQSKGKISNLCYRKDTKGKSGCYIARFDRTEKFEPIDLFNVIDDYFPEENEDKERWSKW